MRISRAITSIGIITLIALLYVHQQIELVKLSYAIERKETKLRDMLDHNEIVVYNIDNLESPSRLEQVLVSKNIDVSFPRRAQVIKSARYLSADRKVEHVRASALEQFGNMLRTIDIFTPRAEAQANER